MAPHVIRFFDLVVLFYQVGILSEDNCDTVRQTLLREGEWLPGAFQKTSFLNGLNNFDPRLLDATHSGVGQLPRAGGPAYTQRLLIQPVVELR